MSELVSTLHEAIAALAASDRSFARFGANQHRYALRAPMAAEELAVLEARTGRLPDDVRELLTTFAAGGAGPYYGVSIGEPYALRGARAIPVGHMGCGYAAVIMHGEIWIDARAVDVVAPMHPSFTAYYLDWIDRLAHGALPDAFVPAGVCPLADALGGFLGVQEQRLGIAAGSISGDALRDALAQLGSGAIQIAANQSPLFADGTAVAPCIACAKLMTNLGLADDVVSAGDGRSA